MKTFLRYTIYFLDSLDINIGLQSYYNNLYSATSKNTKEPQLKD